MTYAPERIALWGIAIYIALLLITPVDIVFPVSAGALGYILLCYAGFFAGCWMGSQIEVRPPVEAGPSAEVRNVRLFWLLCAIGLLGMLLRIYDRLYLRPVDLTADAIAIRDAIGEGETGPAGMVGAVLYPVCYLPLFVYFSSGRKNPIEWMAAGALFVLPAAQAMIVLSRSSMLVAYTMLYFSASVVLYGGRFLPRRIVAPAFLGLIALVVISSLAFNERLASFAWGVTTSIYLSTYAYTVQPNEAVRWLIATADPTTAGITLGILPLLQYYVHGLFEFGILWDQAQQKFSYGALTFLPYAKALNVAGFGGGEPDVYDLFPRVGVFTTFFGPLWVDFGWFGPLFMVVFGIICKVLGRQSAIGRLGAQPLYCFLCVVILFMPVVNLLVGAQGMYLVNAFTFFWLATRPPKPRLVSEADQGQGGTGLKSPS